MGKLGQWLQVFSNIGVLAGLVLVAFQINQGTELARLDLGSAHQDRWLTIDATPIGESLAQTMAKAIDEPQNLSRSEMIELHAYLSNYIYQLNTRAYYVSAGLFTGSVEVALNNVPLYLGNDFAQAWWAEARNRLDFDDQSLPRLIDERLANVAGNTEARFYDAIQARLSERE